MTADGKLFQGRERLMTADGGLFVCVSVFFPFYESDSFIF